MKWKWSLKSIGKLLDSVFGSDLEEEEVPEISEDRAYDYNRPEHQGIESDRILESIYVEEDKIEDNKPFTIPCILVNDSLSVFFLENGDEVRGDKELYDKVTKATTREEIYNLLTPKPKEEEKKALVQNKKVDIILEVIEQTDDFEVRNGLVYMKGINRALPKLLATKIGKIIIDKNKIHLAADYNNLCIEYKALKYFWLWCVSAPKPEVADKLYDFLERNGLYLNKQGFFYALRNVVTVDTPKKDKELMDAITNSYVKIKAWKKSPKNYSIIKNDDGEYSISKEGISDVNRELIGNLDELYKNIGDNEANRYTDQHTGTFDIRVGKPVKMNPNLCSWSTADCNEKGLHFTLSEINYVGCGDTSMLVLINPAKVVGIGSSKGRCYEYLPVMTVARHESTTLLQDKNFDTLQLDEWYAEEELKDLEENIHAAQVIEGRMRQNYKYPVYGGEVTYIVKNLNTMKDTLEKRVVKA